MSISYTSPYTLIGSMHLASYFHLSALDDFLKSITYNLDHVKMYPGSVFYQTGWFSAAQEPAPIHLLPMPGLLW